LIDSFNNDNVSIDDVAKKLALDPVLSAKLLRLGNSAHYHVSRSIGTVEDAVLMLGFVTVRTLVISSGLVAGFKSMPGIDLNKFWKYSMHTAVVAKWLAREARENSDLSFTIGMMHAIGQLVMHVGMSEQALQIDKLAGPLDSRRIDIEKNSFGYTFADVGAELARRWKFPDIFATTIAAFPDPLAQDPPQPLAAIVHLAAWFARTEANALTPEEVRATCPTDVAASLGLDPYILIDKMPSLEELSGGLEEMMS
jgi:HD-like signal output (HDOD) protein